MRVTIVVTSIMLCGFFLAGCSKKGETEPAEEQLKSVSEYQAEAQKEITAENMDQELEKIEKDVEQEISQEQQ